MKVVSNRLFGVLAVASTLILSACGGGGGGSSGGTAPGTGAGAVRLNGIAAAGAPIAGSVVAKDSLGATFGPVTIGADGAYSLTVTGGTAPFILQASGNVGGTAVEIYSTAPDTTATNVNITPLTNVMVAQATGASPATLYSSCSSTSCAAPTKTKVDLAIQQVQALLQALLDKFGITGTVNVLTDTLVAGPVTGQSAIDKMLDVVSIQPVSAGSADFEVKPNPVTGLNTTTVLVTITAPAAGGVTTLAGTSLTVDPALTTTVVNTATTSLTSLQAIEAQFAVLTGLYATAQPAAANPTLLALFDAAWLDWGDNKTTFISNMTNATFGAPAGTKWGSAVATAPRSGGVSNDATHQWFKMTQKMPNGNTEVVGPVLATKIGGTWVFTGNMLAAPNLAVGTHTFMTNTRTINYRTVTDNATLSGGNLTLTKTVVVGATTITFDTPVAIVITPNPGNSREASFSGNAMRISNGTTTVNNAFVTGTLKVREDESIQVRWRVVNTLSNPQNETYGCTTTNNKGCSFTDTGIVGTWKMSQYQDGTPASIQMVLLDDGRFMFLSTNTGGCQQMESGRYGYNPESSLLTLSVEYDTSASCGILQSGTPTFAAPVTIYRTFTPAGVLSSVAGGVTGSFTKQAQTTAEPGTWLFDASSQGQFALVINYASGMYVYAEAPSYAFQDPVASGRGMEYGTYTATPTTYTFATVTYDGNGTTSGVSTAVGTALASAATDVNHISLTIPEVPPVVLTMARQ